MRDIYLMYKLTNRQQRKVVKFLQLLLPILSPSSLLPNSKTKESLIIKVSSDKDFFLPFRQHAPCLANARRVIYANVDRLMSKDGVGFFNILAFRGVFFGSPFAKSDRYQWFNSFDDWVDFYENEEEAEEYTGEEYYVKKSCYGRTQVGRNLSLLTSYWQKRLRWNEIFNKPEKPTLQKAFKWLTSTEPDRTTKKPTTVFNNIGNLTALLICGDLVEAGILPMPSTSDWAKIIFKMSKGSKMGMEMGGLVRKNCSEKEFCAAFLSLDQALQKELSEEEKEAMGYNIIMLEHTLCKIKRLNNDISKIF